MINLLIDTNMLVKAREDFKHPDFQKILLHSQNEKIKIYIPHIVWEERRTQLLEKLISNIRALNKIQKEFLPSKGLLFQGIPPPVVNIINEQEARDLSITIMNDFADINKIQIISLGDDHAERAWSRYFEISAPFNAEQERKKRREDIPDSWILEAAIDLKAKHKEVVVLIEDGRLADALQTLDFVIAKTFQEALDLIDKCLEPAKPTLIKEDILTGVEIAQKPTDELTALLQGSYKQFEGLDIKLLGYVAYLGGASKTAINDLLSSLGVSTQAITNIADKLVMSGMIKDTGNFYLLVNKEAGELAAREVEPEIIKLLEQDNE